MSKARGCGLALVGGLMFCGLGGWAVSTFDGQRGQRELKAELARSTRLGLPPDLADLWPASKNPSKNAAPIYTKLVVGNDFSKAREEADKIGYPKTRADMKALDAVFASVKPQLAEFERASALPECRFQRKPSIDVLFPEYGPMKTGVNLLAYRALNEAAKGDPVEAMRTLTEGARVSAHLGQESVLIAKLVQIATQAIVLRAAQEVLADHGRRADVRAEARKVLVALGPPPSIKDGLMGEWMFQREAPKALESGKLKMDDFAKMASGVASTGSPSDVESKAGELMFALAMKTRAGRVRQELNATRIFLDFYQAMPADASQVVIARKAAKDVDAVLSKGGTDTILAQILMPVFAQANDAAAKSVVERRVFAGLLNALDTPVPPKKLPLSGRDAIDPFTGLPLRYRATTREIRIWSIGPDGNDDGGLVAGEGRALDVTAYWPYPHVAPKKR